MTRGARRCAICRRWLSPDDLGDFTLGHVLKKAPRGFAVSRDLWLCWEHGAEVVSAIKAMAAQLAKVPAR